MKSLISQTTSKLNCSHYNGITQVLSYKKRGSFIFFSSPFQTRRSNLSSSSPISSNASIRRKMSSGSVTENSGYKKSEQPKVITRQRSSTTPSSTNTADSKLRCRHTFFTFMALNSDKILQIFLCTCPRNAFSGSIVRSTYKCVCWWCLLCTYFAFYYSSGKRVPFCKRVKVYRISNGFKVPLEGWQTGWTNVYSL